MNSFNKKEAAIFPYKPCLGGVGGWEEKHVMNSPKYIIILKVKWAYKSKELLVKNHDPYIDRPKDIAPVQVETHGKDAAFPNGIDV